MAVPELIVIAGPTASGKTNLAIQLATFYNTVVLSFDSRQCYQEMAIGTAKPSIAEQQGIPHYFIDTNSVHHPVTAADYERYGIQILEHLFKNHEKVIAVGGTGLYLKALLQGLDDMPPISQGIAEKNEMAYAKGGMEWLQQAVKAQDPLFFNRGEIYNPHRLLRALNFVETHGMSILTFQQQQIKPRPFHYSTYVINVDRTVLYERINNRVDEMFTNGLLQEVEGLYGLKHLKPLQTVGYTELFAYMDGDGSLEEAVFKVKQHTRHYAKRQITWFKHQTDGWWGSAEHIFEKITSGITL